MVIFQHVTSCGNISQGDTKPDIWQHQTMVFILCCNWCFLICIHAKVLIIKNSPIFVIANNFDHPSPLRPPICTCTSLKNNTKIAAPLFWWSIFFNTPLYTSNSFDPHFKEYYWPFPYNKNIINKSILQIIFGTLWKQMCTF